MDNTDELLKVCVRGLGTAAQGFFDLPVHRIRLHHGDISIRVVREILAGVDESFDERSNSSPGALGESGQSLVAIHILV